MATLGQQISALIDEQTTLLVTTTDPLEADKIEARIEDLNEQLDRLIDNSWAPTPEYEDVVKQLSDATNALNDARKGLKTIDDALNLVDTAISALATLAPVLAS